jgi:hypothetical protein
VYEAAVPVTKKLLDLLQVAQLLPGNGQTELRKRQHRETGHQCLMSRPGGGNTNLTQA